LTITDSDGDKITYWSLPDDEIDGETFSIPEFHYTERKGKEYMAVLWNDPKDADLKLTEVNDHFVYSGCNFDELIKKNGKMKCKEPQLYLVLHPKEEWESYHIRNLKT